MPQEKLSKPLSAKLKQKHEYAHSVVKSKSESSVSSQDDLSSEDDSVVIESEGGNLVFVQIQRIFMRTYRASQETRSCGPQLIALSTLHANLRN